MSDTSELPNAFVPDVTVGIVNHNRRGLTIGCLESLCLLNNDLELDVIVIDNATGDGSADEIAACFPQVRLLRQATPRGFAANHNTLAALARAPFYLALNDDTVWLPRDPIWAAKIRARLARGAPLWPADKRAELAALTRTAPGPIGGLLRRFRTDEPIGAVAPLLLWPDGRPQDVSARPFPTVRSELQRYLVPNRQRRAGAPLPGGLVPALSGCALLVRREAWLAVGGMDERFLMFGEDLDFCRRLRLAGWRCWFEPQVQIIHYGSQSTHDQPFRWTVEAVRSSTRYYRRHAGLGTAVLFRAAVTAILLARWGLMLLLPERRAARLKALRTLLGRGA
ncbi:MAG: glycosyltransferase family 2 protein [Ardenticatenaceae bacterium]|nr:glycosyltransferase family 2 protein [Ardenticatenaceae bacterium]